MLHKEFIVHFNGAICHIDFFLLLSFTNIPTKVFRSNIGLMQKYPPIFKKMFLNDVALLWMRGFHAYDTASVS